MWRHDWRRLPSTISTVQWFVRRGAEDTIGIRAGPLEMGIVLSAFFWSYALLQVPAAIWRTASGQRKTLALPYCGVLATL